jgi:hypothetical protein
VGTANKHDSDEVNNMKIRTMMILGLTTLLMACSGGGGSGDGGSGGTTIEGLNLTGTWRFAGIECYDSSFQNLTAVGTPSASSSVGTNSIQGNQLASEDLGTGSCKVLMNRKIVANLQAGDANGGYGTGKFGVTTASTTPSSSCSLSLSFDMISGSITPATVNSTYTQGQSLPEQSFEFVINPPYLAFTSLIQVVGSPTDICMLIYQKL